MKYFKLLLFLNFIFLFLSKSYAKDLGAFGEIWKIEEKDIVSYIKQRLSQEDIQKFNDDFKKNVKSKVNRPKPVKGITESTKHKVHYFNPEVTLKKDITDHHGNILHKKGKKINPLDHQDFTRQLLFINGDKNNHVKFALKKHQEIGEDLKIILIDGSPIELMKKNQTIRFFFDQDGFLSKTFGISSTPSLVKKQDKLIRIETIILN